VNRTVVVAVHAWQYSRVDAPQVRSHATVGVTTHARVLIAMCGISDGRKRQLHAMEDHWESTQTQHSTGAGAGATPQPAGIRIKQTHQHPAHVMDGTGATDGNALGGSASPSRSRSISPFIWLINMIESIW